MTRTLLTDIAVATADHSKYGEEVLGLFRFKDETAFFEKASKIFPGVVLLETCNRVEILVHGSAKQLRDFLHGEQRFGFDILEGEAALMHLLELAAGTKSMIIGEDQILGQMRRALLLAESHDTNDVITDVCLNTAIREGVSIRQKTSINKGAVSIGSAAVLLAEELMGDLDGKNILVVGGGEMGTLVARALCEKNLRAIYVTNRSFDRAVLLAEEIKGRAMRLDQLYPCIALSDVVISCTGAPHLIIHADELAETMNERFWPLDLEPRHLLLIDIAQPRDIDDACRDVPGVSLKTLDDLKSISEKNLAARKTECEHADVLVKAALPEFIKAFNRAASGDLTKNLYTWAEEIRQREKNKALSRLRDADPYLESVIDDLTSALTKKLLEDAAKSIRASAECTDTQTAEILLKAIISGEVSCIRRSE
ncbi:glutamyl-tRNA reductase [Methanocorpusculum labreanum Z]|uniref:Glutamyl-tRNA reductase n=1 Tax=Methanocorpusculum labreanum (strain ATCC 43576 / DSM 4855 / Z) TaxID=410358 RepID=HEM1_METLZ|nr:glutamyl-tRNA reductase [Methanocorpusculum labreanum]A2SQU1.1 RecName: Full=Glutamyl-tRNA reductase; Short=GluTR [Methanocorpusculum labreanum Z]ABN06697.1 glutamyl-tRNA reductase [Methanocorpusculum labreanum Z]